MLPRAFLTVLLLCWTGAASGAAVADTSGRNIDLPHHVTRVLPAGPPAAILLAAVAPDLMLDYGTIAPRYLDLARATQQSTGIPTVLLDGSPAEVPQVFRLLGRDWLGGADPRTLAVLFNAVVHGPTLTASRLDALVGGVHSLQP